MTTHKKEKKEHAPATSATLRDQFAVAALTSLCHQTADEGAAEDLARRAYVLADAMLLAREPHEDAPPDEPVLEGK